jgi:hypothetical protein
MTALIYLPVNTTNHHREIDQCNVIYSRTASVELEHLENDELELKFSESNIAQIVENLN